MKNIFCFFALILSVLPHTVSATVKFSSTPGFDCQQVKTSVEKHICSSEKLSEQDRILSDIYDRLLEIKMPGIKAQQLNWLEDRNGCENVDSEKILKCISERYNFRILELKQLEREINSTQEETWKKYFVTSETVLPENSFKAYYFDERTAGIIRYTEITDNPSINYSEDEFHKIRSRNIGAYYIGNFHFQKSTILDLNIFQESGEISLFINGTKIWQGEETVTNEYLFHPGTYTIEIQFVSRYDSVEFLFTMTEKKSVRDIRDLPKNPELYKDSDLWFCGVYSADSFNNNIHVDLSDNKRKIILFLSSYDPVIWNFGEANTENLQSVYVFSKESRSIVKSINKNIPVIYIKGLPFVYKLCDVGPFKELVYTIQDITQKKITGFSDKKSTKRIYVPRMTLDESFYRRIGMKLYPTAQDLLKDRKSKLDKIFE